MMYNMQNTLENQVVYHWPIGQLRIIRDSA